MHSERAETLKWAPTNRGGGGVTGSVSTWHLKVIASQKVPLCREKPNSSMGKDVSQLEAPFSWAMARFREPDSWSLKAAAASFS